jgi:3-phosphoshikimate 1-carboxyvinyltransferase
MFETTPSPPCYAVAGHPILGSRSAPLYRALFARLGIEAHYTRASAQDLTSLLELARGLDLAGLNITSPLKQAMLGTLSEATPVARAVGATNTAVASPHGWRGDNTDVAGVIATLELHGVSPVSSRVSVLGAGGAARAVLVALAQAGFSGSRLCNRGAERAREVESSLGVPGSRLDQLEGVLATSDLLISCVPGDPNIVPAAWLRPGMVVLDADYRAQGLLRAARLAGCRVIPGSDWLALQAAASFEAFTGERLDAESRCWLRGLAAEPLPTPQGPVVLTGFSGSGKSTVGAILARLLGWAFVDSDQEIQRLAGADIATLFRTRGQAEFRALERRAVAQALAQPRAVVALGGGALLHPETRRQVAATGTCVLLHTPVHRCLSRANDGTRPLLGDRVVAGELWRERRPGYLACADLVLSSDQPSAEAVARQLTGELEAAGVLVPAARSRTLLPGRMRGHALPAPSSKSHGIRALCAATLASGTSVLSQPPRCEDFGVAVGICEALGARVAHRAGSLEVRGIGQRRPGSADGTPTVLDCGESALCLRLFACVAAALGGPFRLEARGSLRRRPMVALVQALRDLGVHCTSQGDCAPIDILGPPCRDRVLLDASGSSQELTGLLMAGPLLTAPLHIAARGLVSRPYVQLTLSVLREAGVVPVASESLDHFTISPTGYRPMRLAVDCDWSAVAFLLVAGATTGDVEIKGVSLDSEQGDKAVLEVLGAAGAAISRGGDRVHVGQRPLRAFRFDATHHPDLFPPLAVLAAACEGRSELVGVGRLRSKESDRALALQQELGALGIRVELDGDIMAVTGGPVRSGDVDAHGDHRIAMALAVAALRADGPCTLTGAFHVAKSYPRFFHDLSILCGGPS